MKACEGEMQQGGAHSSPAVCAPAAPWVTPAAPWGDSCSGLTSTALLIPHLPVLAHRQGLPSAAGNNNQSTEITEVLY